MTGENESSANPFKPDFIGVECDLLGFHIRAVTKLDFEMLERLDSPLLRQMAEGAKPLGKRKETQVAAQEVADMIFQFTSAQDAVVAAFVPGRHHFRQTAKATVERLQLSTETSNALVEAIGAAFCENYMAALRDKLETKERV
jgi:hypothetical protein